MDKKRLDALDAENILRAVEEYVLKRDDTLEIKPIRDGLKIIVVKRNIVGR